MNTKATGGTGVVPVTTAAVAAVEVEVSLAVILGSMILKNQDNEFILCCF